MTLYDFLAIEIIELISLGFSRAIAEAIWVNSGRQTEKLPMWMSFAQVRSRPNLADVTTVVARTLDFDFNGMNPSKAGVDPLTFVLVRITGRSL